MVLYRFAQGVLGVWLIYKFVVLIPEFHAYGIAGILGAYIGGNLADLRTWMLVAGLLLMRWKLRRQSARETDK